MALSGHAAHSAPCPLSGVKRTSLIRSLMSVYDPKRTATTEAGLRRILTQERLSHRGCKL